MKDSLTSVAKNIPDALRYFNELPPEAAVRAPVVAALFGCSQVTIWRWAKNGMLPAPQKLGPRVTAWNVGLIRKALLARQN